MSCVHCKTVGAINCFMLGSILKGEIARQQISSIFFSGNFTVGGSCCVNIIFFPFKASIFLLQLPIT